MITPHIRNRGELRREAGSTKHDFDPFRVISDEEFEKNLNALIAYYQMTKGETKKRFTSQYEVEDELVL